MFHNFLKWARITKSNPNTGQFAVQQMEYLGKVSNGIMIFPYGTHANVPPNSIALAFSIQDSPDNRAVVAWNPKNRPVLESGEVAFYHPPTDAFIIWRETGDLDIQTGDKGVANVNIVASQVTVAGNLSVSGNLSVVGDTSLSDNVTSDGQDISGTHTHGGVQTGGGTSGVPNS